MKSLVTGASGFVGQYLVRHLVEQGDSVVACHSSSEIAGKSPLLIGHPEYTFTSENAQWLPLNLVDFTSVRRAVEQSQPDVIYHLAGMAFVPEAEDNFERALAVNVTGTYNIYQAAKLQHRAIKVILVSSAEVYGKIRAHDLPVSEKTGVKPANNYSLTKAMAEQIAIRFESEYVSSVIIRPFNHIGAGQDRRFVAPNFARQLVGVIKSGAKSNLKVGNLDSKRDFTNVKDIVRAYGLAALKGSGVYNLGTGYAVSIADILNILIEISGLKVSLESDPERMRPSEVPEVRADISKALSELGWEPKIDLRSTLTGIFEYELQNY